MNKAAKKRWVEALLSGEYKQGYGALLQDDGAFCPLGVLCDIEIDGDWEELPSIPRCATWWAIEGERIFPPASLLKRLGLPLKIANLVTLQNDGHCFTFPQMAEFIEAKA